MNFAQMLYANVTPLYSQEETGSVSKKKVRNRRFESRPMPGNCVQAAAQKRSGDAIRAYRNAIGADWTATADIESHLKNKRGSSYSLLKKYRDEYGWIKSRRSGRGFEWKWTKKGIEETSQYMAGRPLAHGGPLPGGVF